LDDLKGKRGYWKLKAVALDDILWRTHFERGCGPVVRQTTEWMNKWVVTIKKFHFSTLYTYAVNACQALEYSCMLVLLRSTCSVFSAAKDWVLPGISILQHNMK
jgi:hypothetical protein